MTPYYTISQIITKPFRTILVYYFAVVYYIVPQPSEAQERVRTVTEQERLHRQEAVEPARAACRLRLGSASFPLPRRIVWPV